MAWFNFYSCLICKVNLEDLYIKCIDCEEMLIESSEKYCDDSYHLCLKCFSTGMESQQHKSDHDYQVIDLKSIKTFDNWNVYQEIQLNSFLLDDRHSLAKFSSSSEKCTSLIQYINKFSQVDVKDNRPFSYDECLKHVEKWFQVLTNKQQILHQKPSNELTKICLKELELFSTDSQNLIPPRPKLHSSAYRLLNGYKPARGDFETETNDGFEMKLIADMDFEESFTNVSDLNFDELFNKIVNETECGNNESIECDDSQLEACLKLSIVDSYSQLIKQRYERRAFVKEHGLIQVISNQVKQSLKSLNESISLRSSQEGLPERVVEGLYDLNMTKTEQIQPFRLAPKYRTIIKNPDDFVKISELFSYQNELVHRLREMLEYRANGITSMRSADLFKKLKLKRLNRVHTVHTANLLSTFRRLAGNAGNSLEEVMHKEILNWFRQFIAFEKNLIDKNLNLFASSQLKYKNNPLKVEDYPENDKLNEEERETCRISRIQPAIFLRVKGILMLEDSLNGHCSYSRARKIAGIDVNRTRVIHTHLVKVGLITANETSVS
jgi:transcriptional adapter 2-alpha